MISLATLHIGDPCPCGDGRLVLVDPKRDTFRCWRVGYNHMGQPSTFHTDHFPMPTSGPGAYTNMTNVAVTPRPSSILARLVPTRASTCPSLSNRDLREFDESCAAPPAIDRARYPHTCAACKGAAYVGFTVIEHAVNGKARCP